jgi:hypothetical protein
MLFFRLEYLHNQPELYYYWVISPVFTSTVKEKFSPENTDERNAGIVIADLLMVYDESCFAMRSWNQGSS